jgi:hypothetical protein
MNIRFKRNWNFGLFAILVLWIYALVAGAPFILSILILILVIILSLFRDFECQIDEEKIIISKPYNPIYLKKEIKWNQISKIEYYKSDIAVKGPMVNDYFNFYLKDDSNHSKKIRADGIFGEKDLKELKTYCQLQNIPFRVI